jgi:hypothetical protein
MPEKSPYFINKERAFRDIKRGQIITLQHKEVFEPVLSVIQSTKKTTIFFKVPDDFLKNNVIIGDEIQCQVFIENYEYVLKGIIKNIKFEKIPLMEFMVENADKYINQRKSKRYNVNLPAVIIVPDSHQHIFSIIKNISAAGAAAKISMMLRDDIMEDDSLYLKVSAKLNETETLDFEAQIIRRNKKDKITEFGMMILDLDEENDKKLHNLLDKLEQDEKHFIEKELR